MNAIALCRGRSAPLARIGFAVVCLFAVGCPNKKNDPSPAATAPGAGGAGAPGSAETGQGVLGNGGASGGNTAAGGTLGGAAGAPGSSGVACGPKTCAAGQVCCNASCGICTPPDGVCTQQLCSQGDGGGAASGPACRQDTDCRLFSDYCTGCDCRALLKTDKDPLCSGPGVRCVADPCRNHDAVCQEGRCTAAVAKTPRP